MSARIAIVGAGVSGLTCGITLAQRGYDVCIFARETGQQTTSAVAAALWFPYDVEPADKVLTWSLITFDRFRQLSLDAASGVFMTELDVASRFDGIDIPHWAIRLGARRLVDSELSECFRSGYRITVPIADTSRYLPFLQSGLIGFSGRIHQGVGLAALEEIDASYDIVVNCSGLGARDLVRDVELKPHRGQVLSVRNLKRERAIVCDDPPLMYAIPRSTDCILGGTNTVDDSLVISIADSATILQTCGDALNVQAFDVSSTRVGLRPFRKSGVRLEAGRLADGRPVIHNYGHGGAGITLSWGCAGAVAAIVADETRTPPASSAKAS